MIEVLQHGSKVTMNGNHDVEGFITGIVIRRNYIQYEIGYFNNGDYKSIWLQEFEITVTNGERVQIGFK